MISLKKFFLFFFCFFLFPFSVYAGSISELTVLNGTLSRTFESDNNTYSVLLDEGETTLKLEYLCTDEQAQSELLQNEYEENASNVAKLQVTNSDGTKETYTFYLEKEEVVPVMKESKKEVTAKVNPYLKWYVILGEVLVISLLFKVLILGKKRR